ncbi:MULTISPECIES: glutaredoxin-like protein NrdH [Photorhabdus]|uniref:Glutaredoxin-like protein NrdH n=1 Tax=Photorhabdus laumondii subsp. laumondii (strain DSM 15139 / CIP 105565 / TT01) TaxID=243265 RepID=Q7N771_PHOLL|nr:MULTISPECIES: glutaredoxin-like protein NrdH [Photorhabdus]AWK41169.1 NrdH-redoxin [Photorhabdus laumondii subsp. laumondii]AXG41904.1 glutaredoxin-like protein NrdH [Photorhabdus laumondii subsp. laumondii]AXG46491.1 glutaredoxin-like protein NrdH [Photorhabdus laumondii subsp. laumondii]KTL62291.1 NrdH-redoxin [Photorhabdus laumondii subsp. laumondii]MCC8386672.1 glutaredoxin-like protein NrdH [Photorhabdus laumondii]
MSITIYSKPDCVQCSATYQVLSRRNIPYQIIDLTENPQALATIRAMGYQQIPVVVAGTQHWSGFRPDKINALIENV